MVMKAKQRQQLAVWLWSIQKTNGDADEAEHDDANAGNDGGVVMMAMLAMILSSNSSCNNVNE